VTETDARTDLHPIEAAERQRAFLLRLVRAAFVILLVTVTLLTILRIGPGSGPMVVELAIGWWLPVLAACTLSALVIGIDVLTPSKKISTLVGVMLGLLAAMLATFALGFVIDLLAATYDIRKPDQNSANFLRQIDFIATSKLLIGICLSYLGIAIVLQTKDDFRLVIPYVEFSKQLRGVRPLLLDTSSLVDARVADLANTGIIQSPLVIPRFVVDELHALADSSDKMKRSKGRRGLDVISKLQRSATLDVSIDETIVPGAGVDQQLVELAKRMPASIVTADLGLKRVAGIQGVAVLNLNDVANALKPSFIPGEQITLRLIKPGEQAGQAVGYLPDGTMVVAEDGAAHVSHEVVLVVTSSLQTSAGRLVFGRVAEARNGSVGMGATEAAAGTMSAGGAGGGPGEHVQGAAADTGRAGAPDVGGEPGHGGSGGAPRPDAGPYPPRTPARGLNRGRNPRR
jgi:uncharacterized protein YacL